MKEIEITIDKDGSVEIDLKGYHGKGCSADAEAFSNALGKPAKAIKKNEYWKGEVKQTQKVRTSG